MDELDFELKLPYFTSICSPWAVKMCFAFTNQEAQYKLFNCCSIQKSKKMDVSGHSLIIEVIVYFCLLKCAFDVLFPQSL